jgi:excisionase family DNA binding protein
MGKCSDLTVRRAARELGCTLKYIYDLLYEGKLKGTKVSREWRIPTAALEALKATRQVRHAK